MRASATRKGSAGAGPFSHILSTVYRRLYRRYGPQEWWPARTRFEMIVGAILTQSTSWRNAEKAIRSMKKAGLLVSSERLRSVRFRRLAAVIRPAGYYTVKAKCLKHFINFLYARYGGSLARMARQETVRLRHELLGVHGIGPETCDAILLYAFGRAVFVVDAYTKRVFSRHGIVGAGAGYDEIQAFCMRNLPADAALYNEYHALIVRLCKDRCRTRPDCSRCVLDGLKVLANTRR